MYKKSIKILVLSENRGIFQIISEITMNTQFGIEIIMTYCEDIKDTEYKVDLIILDKNQKEELLQDISFIKNNNSLAKSELMILLEESFRENIKEFINIGIDEYLFKPFEKYELVMKLKNLIKIITSVYTSKCNKIQFDALLNNTAYMAWFKDKDSNYIKVNNEFKEHCGKDSESIRGRDDKFVWNGEIGDTCKEYDLIVMNERRQIVFEEAIPGKNGYREFNICKSPVIDENNEVIGTVGVARDITELKNKDAKLDIIMKNIPFALWLKNCEGKLINVNDKFIELAGENRNNILGKEISKIVDEKYHEIIKSQDEQVMINGESMTFELKVYDDNEYKIYEINKSPVFDISNKIIGIVGLIRDITNKKKTQQEIERLAYTDYLTGLANRRGVYNYIGKEFNQGFSNATLLFIDLDNFKKINDRCGHHKGDRVLLKISEILKKICNGDFLARVGGDEFVIIWKNVNCENVLKVKLQQVLEGIKDEFSGNDKTKNISASIGVVKGNEVYNDMEEIFFRGDFALYKAKERGKDQYVIYDEKLDKERRLRTQIEEDIKNAIRNNEVEVYYQPQYTCAKEIIGFEALFRWNNDKYRNVPVIDIIRIMEKLGIIHTIEDYILKRAFTFAKNINKKSHNKIVVSVNISAMQLMNKNFVEKIIHLIDKIGVSPELIGIELTETVMLENIEENIEKMEILKAIGITIAIDDFGTGYSSLSYLLRLPISQIKIDKSFIRNISSTNQFINLVKLIVDASKGMSLSIVAEGVEREEELEVLKGMRVDIIQGYLFSKPVPQKDAEKLI